jgi:hypothetical protein
MEFSPGKQSATDPYALILLHEDLCGSYEVTLFFFLWGKGVKDSSSLSRKIKFSYKLHPFLCY